MVIYMTMRRYPSSVSAATFKARCLKLMDVVAETGRSVIVTKRGKPVARLVPIAEQPKELLGYMRAELRLVGDVLTPVLGRLEVENE